MRKPRLEHCCRTARYSWNSRTIGTSLIGIIYVHETCTAAGCVTGNCGGRWCGLLQYEEGQGGSGLRAAARSSTKAREIVHAIYGLGLVEAQRENIPIGTAVPGVVLEVFVDGRPGYNPPHKKVGARVSKGEPLFRIDDRDLKAELKTRESSLRAAVAQLHRLEHMPRAEDLPPAIAAVDEARARLFDAEAAYRRNSNLFDKKMLAASDFDKDRYTRLAAKATLAKAEADLAKLKAGAWKEDIEVQRAAVEQAQSQIDSILIMLERLVVRRPSIGEILQVNVRPGQIATLAWKEPMIVLGEVNRLHVRVDIDENDLYRFREGMTAWANVKGRKEPGSLSSMFASNLMSYPRRALPATTPSAWNRGYRFCMHYRIAPREGLCGTANGGVSRPRGPGEIPGRDPGSRHEAAGCRRYRAGRQNGTIRRHTGRFRTLRF